MRGREGEKARERMRGREGERENERERRRERERERTVSERLILYHRYSMMYIQCTYDSPNSPELYSEG